MPHHLSSSEERLLLAQPSWVSVCSVGGLAGGPGPAPANGRGQRVSHHSREVLRGQSLEQVAERLLWSIPLHLHWVHRSWPNQSSSLRVYVAGECLLFVMTAGLAGWIPHPSSARRWALTWWRQLLHEKSPSPWISSDSIRRKPRRKKMADPPSHTALHSYLKGVCGEVVSTSPPR